MKRFLAFSLMAGVYVLGCTIQETNTDKDPDTNPDAGPVDPGTPDGSAPEDPDAGPEPSKEIDEAPGNDSLDAAQAVPVGSKVNAKMTDAEEDFFSFQLPDGAQDGVLRIAVDEADSSFTPAIAIYTSGKTEVNGWYAPDGTTRPFAIDFHATAGKLYYVKVFNGRTEKTIPYTLESSFTPVPDTFERNDSFDTAKDAPVGPFDLYLFAGEETNNGDDIDFFKADVPAGMTKVRVQIENKSTADAPQLHAVGIHGSNKAEINTYYAAGAQVDFDHTFDLSGSGVPESIFIKFFNTQRSSTIASKATITFE